jgi:hypothetical protein
MEEALRTRGNSSGNEAFYDALENHLNSHHQYALLHFFHPSLKETPAHETLHIALPHQTTDVLSEFLKSHGYVSAVRQSKTAAVTRLVITSIDGTTLSINCAHRFLRKGLCYLSIDNLLQSRVSNGNRYVASLFFDFSYYVITQTLNHAALQAERLKQFEQRACEEQIESTWISAKNFWTNSYGATHSSLSSNVKKYIHSLPMNNFNSRMTYRLNDLLELVKGLLRFPKVALPPRENSLAPLPAPTRMRRLPFTK